MVYGVAASIDTNTSDDIHMENRCKYFAQESRYVVVK